jgi:hypothetical protein
MKNISKKSEDMTGCLSSLRRKFNSKQKFSKNIQKIKNCYNIKSESNNKRNTEIQKKNSQKQFNHSLYIRNSNNDLLSHSYNNIKYNSLKSKKLNKFFFDSDYLNKELEHLLKSYDFVNINNEYNEIDDKSIKIHFRSLLYLVKELSAKNEMLKKEIRNKNNLISSLEKQIYNKQKISLNNSTKDLNSSNILLDNNILKSQVLDFENKLKQQKIFYEDIIRDYKNELDEIKNRNYMIENDRKKLENKFKNSNCEINDVKDELKEITFIKTKLEDDNEKYLLINKRQQEKIEMLENHLKIVLTYIKNLFNKENNILYPMSSKLFYDVSSLQNYNQ